MNKGIFLINKPIGITSHDVVNRLRKITGEKRIGHAGTLDPRASGLLIIAIGREFTSQISKFVGLDKEYLATVVLGSTSTTYDAEGKITFFAKDDIDANKPRREEIINVLEKFLGSHYQVPPIYSAKKVSGIPAYKIARQGKSFKLSPKLITIHSIKLLKYKYPNLDIETKVSSGTYIRSLAHDLGQALGIGAHLKNLKRTLIGNFSVDNSVALEKIKRTSDLLPGKVDLTAD